MTDAEAQHWRQASLGGLIDSSDSSVHVLFFYTSGQKYCLQPNDISVSKQTSSGFPACSAAFKDVLIKLCDSQDSESVQKNNRDELSGEDGSIHNSLIQHKNIYIKIWSRCLDKCGSTCSTSAWFSPCTQIVCCKFNGKGTPCWFACAIDGVACWFRVSDDCHGNKRPLQLHLCAAFARPLHGVKFHPYPHSICFILTVFLLFFPTCFSQFYSFRFPVSEGQISVLSLTLSCLKHFF